MCVSPPYNVHVTVADGTLVFGGVTTRKVRPPGRQQDRLIRERNAGFESTKDRYEILTKKSRSSEEILDWETSNTLRGEIKSFMRNKTSTETAYNYIGEIGRYELQKYRTKR